MKIPRDCSYCTHCKGKVTFSVPVTGRRDAHFVTNSVNCDCTCITHTVNVGYGAICKYYSQVTEEMAVARKLRGV